MTTGNRHRFSSASGLAQALVRLPWNLGLWGLQQTADLVDPRRPWSRTTESLDALSQAAQEPLEGLLGNVQRAGEHLQTGFIDSALHLASGSWRKPRTAIDEAWGVLGRSWNLFTGGDGGRRS